MNKITKFYEVGDLTKAVKGNSRSEKETSTTYLKLAELFSTPRGQDEQIPIKIPLPVSYPSNKKQSKAVPTPSNDDPESLDLVNAKDEKPNKRQQKYILKFGGNWIPSEEDSERTVFVGNLPNTFTRKKIAKLFKNAGPIESIRIRSVARSSPKVKRKLAAIKNDFHPDVKNINAYINFKDETSATAALEMNGVAVSGFHLRVDKASRQGNPDHKSSVFLGNLNFKIDEETLRSHFEECGKITSVRIIRDQSTRMGKGFGYIQFMDGHGVELALKLNDTEVMGRFVRVTRCQPTDKIEAEKSTKNFKKAHVASREHAKRRIMEKNKRLKLKSSLEKKKRLKLKSAPEKN
ncbi:RNA-binding protein 34 [Chamberlinius hualienensis]